MLFSNSGLTPEFKITLDSKITCRHVGQSNKGTAEKRT